MGKWGSGEVGKWRGGEDNYIFIYTVSPCV